MTSDGILITGALGHIGSALVRDENLLQGCRALYLVDNLQTERYCSLFHLPDSVPMSFRQADVADICSPDFTARFDAVVHLAGTVDPGRSAADPSLVFDNNLRITRQVASSCAESGTPLIFVSTTSVYSSAEATVDESSQELSPLGAYAQCKLAEEAVVQSLMQDVPWIVLRLGTIVGPSPGMRFQTAVNKFCWQAVTGQQVHVWRSAMHQVRPYLALSDCTRAIARAVHHGVFPQRVVNAVSWNATVHDVLQTIREAGVTVDVELIDSPLMSDLSFAASTELARSLGFEFNGTLAMGVSETLRWLGPLDAARH